MKELIRGIMPPLLYEYAAKCKRKIVNHRDGKAAAGNHEINWAKHQDLLEWWGKENAWHEIEMLLINCKGKVLDIGCGTGAVISILSHRKDLDLYGCDILEDLIKRCIEKGINSNHLKICSATKMDVYEDNYFDFSYSIGVMQYIKPDQADNFVSEVYRVTKNISFHNAAVSESEKDEGLVSYWHQYLINSTQWWVSHFEKKFSKVSVINSSWKEKGYSKGIWLICYK